LDIAQFIYSFNYWKTPQLLPLFYLELNPLWRFTCRFLCEHNFNLFKWIPRNVIFRPMVSVFHFINNVQPVFQSGRPYHFSSPPLMNIRSLCSTSFLAFGVLCTSELSHCNRYVIVSPCLNFHFPNKIKRWASFHLF
jgi:hypothetical protein